MIRSIRNKIRKNRGFTLVELMIVVAIVGILAALAIYGVRKYMANAKTAEARNSLGQIAKDASAAYNKETMQATVIADVGGGSTDANVHQLCDSSTAVPSATTAIQGKKYQSASSEWDAGSATVGWQCLKFSMSEPQYFQYQYTATNPTSATGTFSARAVGDLDGDGTTSLFNLDGAVVGGAVRLAPTIGEDKPEE